MDFEYDNFDQPIPGEMYALYLSEKGDGTLRYGIVETPVPDHGQVLIKVDSAPLHPADINMMDGGNLDLFN
jgi:NADPH:quinone reductase-like Zn-dependent oxidoreductase